MHSHLGPDIARLVLRFQIEATRAELHCELQARMATFKLGNYYRSPVHYCISLVQRAVEIQDPEDREAAIIQLCRYVLDHFPDEDWWLFSLFFQTNLQRWANEGKSRFTQGLANQFARRAALKDKIQ